MKRSWWKAGLCGLLLVGCSEDLGPVTAAWNQVSQIMIGKLADLKQRYASAQAAVKSLPPLADSDTAGKALKAKIDAVLEDEGKQVGDVERLVSSARVAFEVAVKTGKIANVQKVIDDSHSQFTALTTAVASSSNSLTTLMGQMKDHLAKLAAPATMDFTDIDFKTGTAQLLFDRPASKATLDRLVGYVKSCPEMVVDLVGHTSAEGNPARNKQLSLDRAKAVKGYLLTRGKVDPKKIHQVSGVGSDDPSVAEPAPDSPEAKAMKPADLEEIRRKNRRLTVTTITACPT